MKTCFFLFFVIVSHVSASSEEWVPYIFKDILIKTNEAGYEFSVKLDDDQNLASISGIWNGLAFAVPTEEISGLSKVFLRHAGVKVDSTVVEGPKDRVILVLMYGGSIQTDKGGVERDVPNVIRLHFYKGKYYMYEKSESLGDNSGEWNSFTKEVGKKESSLGNQKGHLNPYLSQDDYCNYP